MEHKRRIFLMMETSRSFGRNVIGGVSQYVSERQHWTLYFQDRSVRDKLPVCVEDWHCDGIISRCGKLSDYQRLQARGVPMIELLGDEVNYFANIRNNEQVNCRMAAEHFIDRGFRNFAYFAMRRNYWSMERLRAFEEALAEYQSTCSSFMSFPRTSKYLEDQHHWGWWKGSEEAVLSWVQGLSKPVGIFCAWDMPAFFLLNVCKANNILVPEEVAILGYGNNADLCNCSTPSLSSIAANGREIGYQAAILLEKLFNHEPLPEKPIEIPATHIAVRHSSDTMVIRDSTVARAIGYIRENIANRPKIADVARAVGVSKGTLHRLFRNATTRSPEDEIQFWCMEWAKELLRETNFSLDKIAHLLCYSSATSFIRAFRSLYGLTPADYRKQFFLGNNGYSE